MKTPGFIVRGVFAVEGSKVFGPSETLYPLSESGAANYLGNEVRILSHGGSSGYARNLSFVAGSVVVGGNPDGGNANLYVGGTSRYDGLKSFTVGSLTGGGISIDATYGNAQLNLAVQGSGEESAAGNPAAKIYGAVSMVSSGNYKSQFVLFNNESVFSLPVADRFSTLQSYSDAERRANVEVGGLRSSGANNSIYAVSAPTVVSYEGSDRHFKYEANLVVNSAASADCAYSPLPPERTLRVSLAVYLFARGANANRRLISSAPFPPSRTGRSLRLFKSGGICIKAALERGFFIERRSLEYRVCPCLPAARKMARSPRARMFKR